MKSAKKITKTLLKNKQAVCINITDDIRSFYLEDNKIKSSSEVSLLIKTISDPKSVISSIKVNHDYEVPFITILNSKNTNKEYLDWAKKS